MKRRKEKVQTLASKVIPTLFKRRMAPPEAVLITSGSVLLLSLPRPGLFRGVLADSAELGVLADSAELAPRAACSSVASLQGHRPALGRHLHSCVQETDHLQGGFGGAMGSTGV